MLLQEECHKEVSTHHLPTNPMAIVVEKRRTSPYGGQHKYSYQDKTKPPSSSKKPLYFCDHWKLPSHLVDRCFKIDGYPNKSKPSQLKQHVAAFTLADNNPTSIDSSSFGLTPDQFANLLSYLCK